MCGDRRHLESLPGSDHPIDDTVLNPKSGWSVALPLTREGFVVEALDHSESWWAGDHRYVLPLLVSFQNLLRRHSELLVDATMLLNAPHLSM